MADKKTRPRRKYIERINTTKYVMDFFTFDGGLFIDFDDKVTPTMGCYYSFSQNENDWISAIKLANAIKATMKREGQLDE